jgi:hypothetical protein
MGPPLSERPPVPTEVQRLAAKEAERAARDARQASKGRHVAILRQKERMEKIKALEAETLALRTAKIHALEMLRSHSHISEIGPRLNWVTSLLLLRAQIIELPDLPEDTLSETPKPLLPLERELKKAASAVQYFQQTRKLLKSELNSLSEDSAPGVFRAGESAEQRAKRRAWLELAITATQDVIPIAQHQAKLKIERIKKYLETIQGKEEEFRQADFEAQTRYIEGKGETRFPIEAELYSVMGRLGFTRKEKRAARIELHGEEVQLRLDQAKREKEKSTTDKLGQKMSQEQQKPGREMKREDVKKANKVRNSDEVKKPEEAKKPEEVEKSEEDKKPEEGKKNGGVRGWFGL